ncbi:MAG: hypothetical protein ACC707_16355 [Thiohalomonadales bacterium]
MKQKQDPLIQFRVTDAEYAIITKQACDQTRTIPNWAKAIILKELKK